MKEFFNLQNLIKFDKYSVKSGIKNGTDFCTARYLYARLQLRFPVPCKCGTWTEFRDLGLYSAHMSSLLYANQSLETAFKYCYSLPWLLKRGIM